GLQVGQGEQKTKGISECERKIKKIKTMRGEIALANGVFQQPVKRAYGSSGKNSPPKEAWPRRVGENMFKQV
ncbi:hypothetical protein, partial [Limnohabitans sp. 2KL-17]|uniref:hypothetical protein n=1 Tax=Limnohabitans sp. 2KL-17 TaxID=1100704 RepID=UPI001E2EA92E